MAFGPGFRIEAAYDFAEQHRLGDEAAAIRAMLIHPSIVKGSTVRKGHLVTLFEEHNVMDDFVAQHWPGRHSPASERRYKTIKQRMDLNKRRLNGEPVPGPDGEGGDSPGGGEDFPDSALFAIEAHLRDFIAGGLARVPLADRRLALFKNATGRSGVEYPTTVGPIDILTIDQDGNFYVFELKLARGPDKALGQLARYMGWVKIHLAQSKSVTGVIVANAIDEKLRYAASVFPGVILLEYSLAFSIRGIPAMQQEITTPSHRVESLARAQVT